MVGSGCTPTFNLLPFPSQLGLTKGGIKLIGLISDLPGTPAAANTNTALTLKSGTFAKSKFHSQRDDGTIHLSYFGAKMFKDWVTETPGVPC